MAKKATKAADNNFYKARMEAASFNDSFNSREGAAEILGIDRTRLARIELGSLSPYPEEVLLMSDAYNAVVGRKKHKIGGLRWRAKQRKRQCL